MATILRDRAPARNTPQPGIPLHVLIIGFFGTDAGVEAVRIVGALIALAMAASLFWR